MDGNLLWRPPPHSTAAIEGAPAFSRCPPYTKVLSSKGYSSTHGAGVLVDSAVPSPIARSHEGDLILAVAAEAARYPVEQRRRVVPAPPARPPASPTAAGARAQL
jgi:hypothetical protein